MSDFFDDAGDDLDDVFDDVERGAQPPTGGVVGRDDGRGDGAASTTSPAAQITRLYDTVFDRAPDDAGLRFWTVALRAGTGLDDMAELLVASPEFRGRYGDLDDGGFVGLLYRNVLDREADDDGLAFWTANLVGRRVDRDDVVLAFSESDEHVARIGPVRFDDDPFD